MDINNILKRNITDINDAHKLVIKGFTDFQEHFSFIMNNIPNWQDSIEFDYEGNYTSKYISTVSTFYFNNLYSNLISLLDEHLSTTKDTAFIRLKEKLTVYDILINIRFEPIEGTRYLYYVNSTYDYGSKNQLIVNLFKTCPSLMYAFKMFTDNPIFCYDISLPKMINIAYFDTLEHVIYNKNMKDISLYENIICKKQYMVDNQWRGFNKYSHEKAGAFLTHIIEANPIDTLEILKRECVDAMNDYIIFTSIQYSSLVLYDSGILCALSKTCTVEDKTWFITKIQRNNNVDLSYLSSLIIGSVTIGYIRLYIRPNKLIITEYHNMVFKNISINPSTSSSRYIISQQPSQDEHNGNKSLPINFILPKKVSELTEDELSNLALEGFLPVNCCYRFTKMAITTSYFGETYTVHHIGLNFINQEMSDIIGEVTTISDEMDTKDYFDKYNNRLMFYNNKLSTTYFIENSPALKDLLLRSLQYKGNVCGQKLRELVENSLTQVIPYEVFHSHIKHYRMSKYRRMSVDELTITLIRMLEFNLPLDREFLTLPVIR